MIFFILGIYFCLISTFVFSQQASMDLKTFSQESQSPFQKGKGIIKNCTYAAGENVCGTCYCLEPLEGNTLLFNDRKVRGCAVLNYSKVGDLSTFVGKTVNYEGTSEFETTFACPQHFQLLKIAVDEKHSQAAVQKGKGIIETCEHNLGERLCGKCYTLKPIEGSTITFNDRVMRGSAVLDCSQVGDLSDFVGKTVYYEGTSEFEKNLLCPQHFQLFTIRLIEESQEI